MPFNRKLFLGWVGLAFLVGLELYFDNHFSKLHPDSSLERVMIMLIVTALMAPIFSGWLPEGSDVKDSEYTPSKLLVSIIMWESIMAAIVIVGVLNKNKFTIIIGGMFMALPIAVRVLRRKWKKKVVLGTLRPIN